MKTAWIGLGVMASLCTGCISTATFYSEPSRARVTLDNRKILGETPLQVQEQVFLWTAHTVTVEKAGYKPQMFRLEADTYNYRSAMLCLCSATVLWPAALTADYVMSRFDVTLEPVETASASGISPGKPLDFDGLAP